MFKIGAKYRTHGAELLVSGFYSHGKNMIDWVYETEEATKYHALNIGKIDNMGFTAEAILHLSELLPGGPLTTLKAGYAYIYQEHETDHQICKSLYALEYLRHKFICSLDHKIWSKLSASWSLRWQQRMNGFHPYAKLDCKVMWTADNYRLYVMADNITSHRYYDIGGVKQPGIWIMAGGSIKFNL